MRRNTPPGWAGFIASRRKPETKPKGHANTTHGCRSRAAREAMAECRAIVRAFKALTKGRELPGELSFLQHPRPDGWRGFVRARNCSRAGTETSPLFDGAVGVQARVSDRWRGHLTGIRPRHSAGMVATCV
jgi:hypothetical protein